MTYRRFARLAALVFAAVSLYTLIVKGGQGRLDEDWVHTLLHLTSGAAGAVAGWLARGEAAARLYTVAVAVAYLALGVVGWFVDGFLLASRFAIPLAAADNVFHLLLAALAVAAVARGRREVRRADRPAPVA